MVEAEHPVDFQHEWERDLTEEEIALLLTGLEEPDHEENSDDEQADQEEDQACLELGILQGSGDTTQRREVAKQGTCPANADLSKLFRHKDKKYHWGCLALSWAGAPQTACGKQLTSNFKEVVQRDGPLWPVCKKCFPEVTAAPGTPTVAPQPDQAGAGEVSTAS